MLHKFDQEMMSPLELTWLLNKGMVAQLPSELFVIAHMLPFLLLMQEMIT